VRTALSPNSQRLRLFASPSSSERVRSRRMQRRLGRLPGLSFAEACPIRLCCFVLLTDWHLAYAGASITSPRAVGVRSGEATRLDWCTQCSKRQQEAQQEWRQNGAAIPAEGRAVSCKDPQRTLAVATATLIQVQTPIRCITANRCPVSSSNSKRHSRTSAPR